MKPSDHLKLFLADALVQVIGYHHEGLVYGVLSLDTRQRHILRERRRMTTRLWYDVLNRSGWRCARCGTANWRNRDNSKPTMEVDHIKALYNFGKTELGNLQCLCRPCNRTKGVS